MIKQALRNLAIEPETQGKALTGDLEGYRSLRVVGQRYRIIYKAEGQTVTVYIVAVGIRKEGDKADVYEVANKLFQAYIEKRSRHKKPTGQ